MTFYKIIFFFIALVASAGDVCSQSSIDSLKGALNKAKHDTTRVKIYSRLSEICDEQDIYENANQTLLLSEKLLAKEGTFPKEKLLRLKSDALNNIGYALQLKGENSEALVYYGKALKIKESIHDEKGAAGLLNNIAYVYNIQGRIEEALDYYLQSLNTHERLKDHKAVAICLNNIGSIYDYQNDIKNAKEFYLRSSEFAKMTGDSFEICVPLVNLAILYAKEANYERAIETNLFCINVFKRVGNPYGLHTCYNNLGEMYEDQGEHEKAFQYYQLAIREAQASGDKLGEASSINNLAIFYYIRQKMDSAEFLGNKALLMAKHVGSAEITKRAAEILYRIYRDKKDFPQSLEMYDLFISVRDSINNENTRKASLRSQLKYEYEKKATADSVSYLKETEVRNAKIAQQTAEIKARRNQQIALFGGLGLVVVFAGFIFNRFKVAQKQKTIIESQKKEVESQKSLVEEKQKEILDSIHYARRIQNALITNEKYIERSLKNLKA